MVEIIDAVLQRFSLKSRVFFAGNLCNFTNFDAAPGVAHLHLVRDGELTVTSSHGPDLHLTQPSLLFFPRSTNHRLLPAAPEGVDMICTSVEFGLGQANPLVQALPSFMLVPLAEAPGLQVLMQLFFDEAFGSGHGRAPAMNRLAELVLILTLRHALERGLLKSGMMAGLADARLSKAMSVIHANPDQHWTLNALATLAGMSRARFAAHFMNVVGIPPGDYLSQWRISVAQSLLAQGRPVKLVADDVGYGSATALTRAFSARTGLSPTAWLATQSV